MTYLLNHPLAFQVWLQDSPADYTDSTKALLFVTDVPALSSFLLFFAVMTYYVWFFTIFVYGERYNNAFFLFV